MPAFAEASFRCIKPRGLILVPCRRSVCIETHRHGESSMVRARILRHPVPEGPSYLWDEAWATRAATGGAT